MTDQRTDAEEQDGSGEEPEAESGAGYGSHAAETQKPGQPASGTQ